MTSSPPDPTARFSNRVAHYVGSRPGYPAAILPRLQSEIGLSPASLVADLGSGTGISSELFLRFGCRVLGVEPNREMRAAAERQLARYPGFVSVDGRAEATTLPPAMVDVAVAGQAFHWFDREATRRELARILRSPSLGPPAPASGWVVLLWNRRHTTGSDFLRGYEELLARFGTDYQAVDHRQVDAATLRGFFAAGSYAGASFPNQQSFDLDGLRARLRSSSYTPPPGHPKHISMLMALDELFARTAADDRVHFEYTTEVHWGRV